MQGNLQQGRDDKILDANNVRLCAIPHSAYCIGGWRVVKTYTTGPGLVTYSEIRNPS